MPSADFWRSFPTPLSVGSTQADRQISPGMTHSASRLCPSDIRRSVPCKYWALHILACSPRCADLISASCSSGQRFASSFLRIPPRGGHPCRSANTSPCRVCRGLSPPSECALPGAPKNKGADEPAPRDASYPSLEREFHPKTELPRPLPDVGLAVLGVHNESTVCTSDRIVSILRRLIERCAPSDRTLGLRSTSSMPQLGKCRMGSSMKR